MEVKTFAFLQIAVFIALGIQIFLVGTDALNNENELFSVEYCGTNCTQQDTGSWTKCSGNCTCYHEDGKKSWFYVYLPNTPTLLNFQHQQVRRLLMPALGQKRTNSH
uniref:Putative secreted protein n=1 Tax=Ixodes ricinus TaxID=34613 RepID=V5ICS9_IXORI